MRIVCVAAALVAPILALGEPALAVPTEKVIYTFAGGAADGATPNALYLDHAGNLFATTNSGGQCAAVPQGGCGTVVKLSPPAAGQTNWTETVLYNFAGGSDGINPAAAIVADPAGNLYTTTLLGGGTYCSNGFGCGTMVELSPPAAGQTAWTESVLYQFGKGTPGTAPRNAILRDSGGSLYLALSGGGTCFQGCGSIQKLTPPAAGSTSWTATVLHGFKSYSDGDGPGALLFDPAGNLYTATYTGGLTAPNCSSPGCGTVAELTPPASRGRWAKTTLYSFTGGADGSFPYDTVAGAAGEFYVVTEKGTVVRLTPPGAGQSTWTETLLYSFPNNTVGTSLIRDGRGRLYITVYAGPFGAGAIIRLTPPAAGQSAWKENVLYRLKGAVDGVDPVFPVADSAGNLYMTTATGGAKGAGTVIELSRIGFAPIRSPGL
jgi:uncharacterized protein YceK